LPIKKSRDVRIEFHVVSWVTDAVLDSLELFVNGDIVPLEKEPIMNSDGYLFSGIIPKRVLKKQKGSSEFEFRVKETLRPIDIMPNNPDERQIGLCYTHLSIEPLIVDRQVLRSL
jgi:hypothetical protein